jgi:hypothetical protein
MDPRPAASLASLIAAAGLGALAMYVLDPQSGRQRVARARDRARQLAHEAGDAAGTGWRDMRDRVAADARQRLHRDSPTDRALEQRVRDELGRWVTHPHAARVRARDGAVVLSGCVLAAERAQLQRAVEGVKGVERVELRLAVIDTPDGMPSAPGDGASGDARTPSPIVGGPAPGTQLLGMTASAALLASGMAQRGVPGLLLSAAGMAIGAGLARHAFRTRHDGLARQRGLGGQPLAVRPSAAAQDASGDARDAADGEPSASRAAG